jgi:hypothetical protein
MSQLYTVIALDQDYDNCDIKYIGVFSNYELAKGAADAHSITYGKSTRYDSKYEYKIFLSTLDEGVNIDTEKDLLYKEKEEKYAKYMEDQKLANEKIIKAQQKENKSQVLHIKEIVRLLDFNIEVDQLTAIEKDSIIMFFDLYFELMHSSYHGYASRSIVLKAVNNFNIFLEIVKKYNFQTNEYLQFMLDVYKNHGIKVC